ncbi:T9SS type A sorting domain-containing protein [Ferruginibacter albus]|uniref:T9SS type A sorting domain-containing protein n=1 Tax=Ferruginibacter albus TaxID=2875540 RepID=UPI001CC40B8E|nr:T9SS type A sorting domain-containing protein [Ferruginibacter albus]UAY52841.1 T9SS type A sorting domain-containing protein [Ferruginibacter albus]
MKTLVLLIISAVFVLTVRGGVIVVTPLPPTDISYTTATVGVQCSSNSGSILERGVVWSTTNTNPTVADNKIILGSGNGRGYLANAGPFPPGTVIYMRGYINYYPNGIYYGPAPISFTTKSLQGVGGIYDFESASGTYTGFNTDTMTATNTATSSAMQVITATDGVFRASANVSGQTDKIGSEALYFGMNGETKATYKIQGNNIFDLTSFYLTNQTSGNVTYTITSSKGSHTLSFVTGDTTGKLKFVDMADSPDSNYFKGVTSFTITPSEGAWFETDNLVVQNIKTNTILPLRFISFAGTIQDHTSLLKWTTSNEVNTKEMQVEKSIDGINFISIASIPAVGTGNNTYSFTDIIKENETNYYRIKTIDLNGNTSLSSIISITDKANKNENLKVFPNFITSSSNIALQSPLSSGKIIIYNENGATVGQQLWQEGQLINIAGIKSGSYFIQLTNGKQLFTNRFIKE